MANKQKRTARDTNSSHSKETSSRLKQNGLKSWKNPSKSNQATPLSPSKEANSNRYNDLQDINEEDSSSDGSGSHASKRRNLGTSNDTDGDISDTEDGDKGSNRPTDPAPPEPVNPPTDLHIDTSHSNNSPSQLPTPTQNNRLTATLNAARNEAPQTRENPTQPTTFKKVNNRSNNRRECRRIIANVGDLREVENNKRKHKNSHYSRVTLKLTIEANDDPAIYLSDRMKDLLCELQEADNSLTLIPWKESDYEYDPIAKPSEIPPTVTKLKKYFDRLYLPKPGQATTLYSNIHIGHDCDFQDIREDVQLYLNQHDHGLY